MGAFSPHVWAQLKSITADDLIAALGRARFTLDPCSGGSQRLYIGPNDEMVNVHYHPNKTFGPKLLKDLLEDTGWDEKQMRAIKLIK